MFHVLNEDIPKIMSSVDKVIRFLGNGASKVEENVSLENALPSLKISGYWVEDVMRIDIKIKQ